MPDASIAPSSQPSRVASSDRPIKPVGLVLGSMDATPLEFWIAVGEGQVLQLDDLVVVETVIPDGTRVSFYGIVDIVRKRFEGNQFDTDAFRVAAGTLPAEVSYAAHVQVTRVDPEIFVPPAPGDAVAVVRGEAFRRALYFDRMERTVPIGLTRAGESIFANLEFLDGTRGAHASISGVSGVATKTSYATFLIYSLFHSGALGIDAANAKALIFNVKGEDLLWLDKPNARLRPEHQNEYEALGLPSGPFQSVSIFAPARRGSSTPVPDTGSRQNGVNPYVWTIREFARNRFLRFAFAGADDVRAQFHFVITRVERELERASREGDETEAAVTLNGVRIGSFGDLVELFDTPALDAMMAGAPVAGGTLDAFRRRLHAAAEHMGHLVSGDSSARGKQIDWSGQQVTVVDIHTLHSTAQMFVVGVLLKRMMEQKELQGGAKPLVFVVLDELNKYSPREGWSPIRDVLLDIAERGRSLGVSLLGAQQTASEVERRIVANAAIKVVGRLDAAEADRGEYGFLTTVGRKRAAMLQPGSMIVSQPEIPMAILLRFPFPCWATRKSEVAAAVDAQDPFARMDDASARVAGAQREFRQAHTQTEAAQSEVRRQSASHEHTRHELTAIPGLRKRIQALDELRGVIERQSKVADEVQSTNSAIATTTKDHKAAVAELRKAESTSIAAERELADARTARKTIGYDADRYRALQQVVADAIRGLELHRQLTAARRQATVAANKATEAEVAAKDASASVEKHKAAFDRAHEQVSKAEAALQLGRNVNHAAALRPTLEQDEPCPVCEHIVERLPRRLRAPELEGREDAVEQAKRAESKANRTLEQSREIATGAVSQAKERREVAGERAGEVEEVDKGIAKASKKVASVVAASQRVAILSAEGFEAISNEADTCATLKQQFEAAGERINRADLARQQAGHRQDQAATAVQHLLSRSDELRTRLSHLEEEACQITSRIVAVTKSSDPAGEREQLSKRVAALEASERKAQEVLEAAKRSLERAIATERGAEQGVTERQAEADRARTEAAAALAESGFADLTVARAAVLSVDAQQRLDASIRGYETERHQVEVRILELEKALSERYVTEQDHREAGKEAHRAAAAHHATLEVLTRSRQDVERLTLRVERAVALRKEKAALEDRSAISEQLARDLKNDGFQRYLLEEAFRGLVAGASVRMKEWTNRYTLQWDDGAFYAIDHDNGGERRRAETLSGGETFLASLSLALQLSEEILRTAGAVQIDSLFIDEGFGTLDAEALEIVTDAIESLRSGGRMVGIITHIRDLTERLPGCIEIEKGLGQSRWKVARVG